MNKEGEDRYSFKILIYDSKLNKIIERLTGSSDYLDEVTSSIRSFLIHLSKLVEKEQQNPDRWELVYQRNKETQK